MPLASNGLLFMQQGGVVTHLLVDLRSTCFERRGMFLVPFTHYQLLPPGVKLLFMFGRVLLALFGCVIAIGSVVGSLYLWNHPQVVPIDFKRADIFHWSIRLVAVAGVALAQVIIVKAVIVPLFGRQGIGSAVRVCSSWVGGLSLLAAAAVGYIAWG